MKRASQAELTLDKMIREQEAYRERVLNQIELLDNECKTIENIRDNLIRERARLRADRQAASDSRKAKP